MSRSEIGESLMKGKLRWKFEKSLRKINKV